ncbi:MAG: hypothetical protein JWO82_2548 [Akkermansiaceae bacterium]|nr:hypothetical protein [Akkermansiaceae bacterium]
MQAKEFVVPACLAHLAVSIILLSVAFHRAIRSDQSIFPSLLPVLIAAAITGILTVGTASLHWLFHNRMTVDPQMLKMRFGGPYWWVYSGTLTLPLFPSWGSSLP